MDQPAPASASTPPASNLPEYSVSDISSAVKRTLESAFGRVRVRGEVTEVKRYPSGHIYFALKDEGGKISAVAWKFSVGKLGMLPENGIEVIATGKVSSYGDRSSYQLIVDRLEFAGAGALLARIEALKAKLGAEGLFDPERRRALPMLPSVIGVVSSPQGAVIQDIRTTIARRFPRPILLWPVPVQGEGAAAKIAAAIRGFSAMAPGGAVPRPDVIIVARGGGSLEDLMAFNEEIVVRAAAECSIPLISAVGHETDTTLIDFASDRRAPTPTAAAEMAIPARLELLADLAQRAARLGGAYLRGAQMRRMRLDRAAAGLPDLPGLLGTARQRLDDRGARLSLALPALVQIRRSALLRAERGMPPGMDLVRRRAAGLALMSEQLRGALRQAVARRQGGASRVLARFTPAPLLAGLRQQRARLEGVAGQLESLSPMLVLARGYALVLRPDGQAVTEAAAIRPGQRLRLRFADGEVEARSEPKAGTTAQGRLPI